MLGDDMNNLKIPSLSIASLLGESMDQKSSHSNIPELINLIEDRDRTIRKLTKKIEKLEDTLKKTIKDKGTQLKNFVSSGNDNKYLELLKAQIQKTQKLEDIIEDITQRVGLILEDVSKDKTLTENSQEIKIMLHQMEVSRKFHESSSEIYENQLQRSINISAEWVRKIDILEGVFKSYKIRFNSLQQDNMKLHQDIEKFKDAPSNSELKGKHNEQIKQLSQELKEEKKQTEKLRKLLDKTEFQKNQLINKIHQSQVKHVDVKAKTKDELVQFSKELQYKVKDLEIEKESILKHATKDKQDDLKKYQQFLKKLKIIKERSLMGKSSM